MFDRTQKGYLDEKELSSEALSRFDDEYSTRYLHFCFSPEFAIRVREKEKPTPSVKVGGLGEYTFNTRKQPKEVV